MGTREDLLERADGVLERDKLALVTSEDLGDLERLRHETLDLTSTLDLNERVVNQCIHAVIEYATYGQLVLLRQLIHSENSNDILQRLVILEDLLHSSGNVVVLLSDLDNT